MLEFNLYQVWYRNVKKGGLKYEKMLYTFASQNRLKDTQ